MASEHILQLKAVLDASDVQQKLGQLKQQTGSGSGNGLGNGGIQQALQRLNTTLTNLQRSIDKLSTQQVKQTSSPDTNRMPFVVPPNRWPTSGKHISPEQQTSLVAPLGLGKNLHQLQRLFVRGFGFRITPNMNRNGIAPVQMLQPVVREWRNFQKHGLSGKKLWKSLEDFDDYYMIEQWQMAQGSADAFQNRINNLRRKQVANNPILSREKAAQQAAAARRMTPQMKANLRMGASFAFGTIAGGVANYAQATGNQDLATGANFVQNMGYGAATGALIGGPVGAVIGGSVGALNAAFEELARRAREAASALDEQHKRVFSGQKVDNALADMFRSQKDRQALEKNDRSYFEQQLKSEREQYKKTTESLQKEVGLGGEGLERFNLREYEKETERLMKLRGQDDAEVLRRQNVATLYTANATVLQKSDARIAELERVLKSLGPEPRTPLNKRRADAAAEQAKSLKEALAALKAPDMTNVNSLASQGFMISTADDESRLDEANKHLTDLVNLTRQIKDKEDEAAVYG